MEGTSEGKDVHSSGLQTRFHNGPELTNGERALLGSHVK